MKKNSGFSLIELILVLTIVSILTSLAYPLYTQYVAQAQRKRVEIILYNLANRMERYYVENNHSYANITLDQVGFNTTELKGFYEITLTTTDTTYALQATPLSHQAKNDNKCGILSLNHLGEKKIAGAGPLNVCW